MDILQFLNSSAIVDNFKILDYKFFEFGFYIKILVVLKNNSEIHISEYVDEFERNYSYHWQNANKKLILRYDNAPYHKEIDTFPHHIHHGTRILRNREFISCEILNAIEKYYNKHFTDKV